MLHHLTFDWNAGAVKVEKTLFLSDPDKKAPFPIAMEGSDEALPHRCRLRRRIHPTCG